MSGPQSMHLHFHHQGVDYDISLFKGEMSEHTVKIGGATYAVLGKKGQLDAACAILRSISLNSISSEEDLKGRLSARGGISFPTRKTEGVGVRTLTGSNKARKLDEAYKRLVHDLNQYVKQNLKQGALLVQVIGIERAEKPLTFGIRSLNDADPVQVDANTIGRTGSGAKLWAGLLTNILTSKYGRYIQMDDGLGKFAPEEALRKFGRIGPDGRDIVDAELAKEISVEGLAGMMAGLEYEQPNPKNPPLSTLDQFLRGDEIKEGSIHILHHPRDHINVYTNNICFVAYPIEKAYKKVLAEKLIEQGKLRETDTLGNLAPHLEKFKKKLEGEIEELEQQGRFDLRWDVKDTDLETYKTKLAYLRTELEKLTIPESLRNLSLKELLDCNSAYTVPPSEAYIYDLIDLFLMPTGNHRVDYAEIMKRELLEPMGMDHSGFHDVPGIHMDVTFENDKTKKDESYTPSNDHPMRYGAGFGSTTLIDASKLANGLSDGRGLVAKDGKTVLLSRTELDDFFKPHGHYKAWGLGGAELTCGGQVIDKGGSLNQDQYSFWVDRDSGIGMIAMCNCGRRPEAILNAFKESIEKINYPEAKPFVKEKEGSPLGISADHYFAHPLVSADVKMVFEGTRGRVALLFDYDTAEKGIMHWSGAPLEVERREDGIFHVTTPGRFKDVMVKKISGEISKTNYLAVGDTAFTEIGKDALPAPEAIERAEKEFVRFKGRYINHEHPEWGVLQFDVLQDKEGKPLLGARDGDKGDFIPQSIIKVETHSILFNGHDRQPPDKVFRFVRNNENAPWRLQVLDFASREAQIVTKKWIEERPKS
ncbi:MAG: serine hydrolase [Parachlamydiaceae bacterium]